MATAPLAPANGYHGPTSSSDSDELSQLREKLAVERSIAEGAANLLRVFEEDPSAKDELKGQVEEELLSANVPLLELRRQWALQRGAQLSIRNRTYHSFAAQTTLTTV